MEIILSGREITLRYTEPTENRNDTPLTDLDHTSIYTVIDGTKAKIKDVPATALTGGGSIEEKFIVEVGEDQEVDVEIQVTASDGVGNESTPPLSAVKRIDNLAPKSPS